MYLFVSNSKDITDSINSTINDGSDSISTSNNNSNTIQNWGFIALKPMFSLGWQVVNNMCSFQAQNFFVDWLWNKPVKNTDN